MITGLTILVLGISHRQSHVFTWPSPPGFRVILNVTMTSGFVTGEETEPTVPGPLLGPDMKCSRAGQQGRCEHLTCEWRRSIRANSPLVAPAFTWSLAFPSFCPWLILLSYSLSLCSLFLVRLPLHGGPINSLIGTGSSLSGIPAHLLGVYLPGQKQP